ncbi:MAG: T9SS type A sorting domain-containing protein [Chloroherpetonaceae bacterium]
MIQRYFLFALLALFFFSETAFAQLASQPTVQASNMKVVSANSNSVSLRWTNGNGQRRLVTMRLTNSAASPTDGATYTASTTFGSGSQIGTGTFVVYNGTDTTVTVTGLSATSGYSVGVWEYNGLTAGTQNYNTSNSSSNLVSFYTTTLAPTTSPSNLSFSNVTPTSMQVNFTAGNGQGRVVIARPNSAVNVAPPSGVILMTGQQLGNGNFVAGITSGGQVFVSSLAPGTLYHFAVYEFNGGNLSLPESNSSNRIIRTASPLLGSRSSLATEPTVQASGITNTFRSSTSISVSWTNGNGNQRIVVACPSTSPAANIDNFDGQTLNASLIFGNGSDLGNNNFVVFKGTGTSVLVSGLSSSTTYNFRVYEFNVAANGTENYLGSIGVGNNITVSTLAPVPTTQASGVSVQNPATNALTIRWQNGNGARRLVVASQSSIISAPQNGRGYVSNSAFGQGDTVTAGVFVVANTTNDSVRVTGLSPNTLYYFRVFEFNGAATTPPTTAYNTSTISNGSSRTTLSNQPTVNVTNLSALNRTDTSVTLRWTNGNGNQRVIIAQTTGGLVNPVNGTVYSSGGNRYASGTLLGGTAYCVYVGSDTSVTITGLSPATLYTFAGYELNVGNAGSQHYQTINPSTLGIPSLATRPTVQASGIVITQTSQNVLKVKWTSGNGSERILVGKLNSPVDYVPQNGSNPVVGSTQFNTGTPLGNGNLGLYSGTGDSTTFSIAQAGTYHFRVFELNGATTQQGGTHHYLTTTGANNPNSGSGSILSPAPTSQVGALIFSEITDTSMRVSFSQQGNGIGKMLFAKAGSPVDELPQGGVTYTANTNFNQAQNLNGTRVVYDGVAVSVLITGLSPNTTYHFRAFAYNGSGTNINYLTTAVTGNPASQATENAFTGSGNIPGGTYTRITTSGASTLTGDVTVTGNISLTGILNTGSNTLTLAQGATLTETPNNYVVGRVEAIRAITGGAIEATETFSGMGVSLTTTNNLGNVSVQRFSGAQGIVTVGSATGIARRWNISSQALPITPATLALSWVSNDDNGKNLSLGRVYRRPTSPNDWIQIASGNYTSRTASFSTNSFGEFTISDANNQLPVELVSFIGGQHREGVMLQWSTASELNNSGFEVERKSEGATWNTLGFVRGNGTTNEAKSYSFLDRTASGKVQYRLKQIDFDGQFEYSPIIEVDAGLPKQFTLSQNYPNPFNPTTVISYQLPTASTVSLKIYDVLGKEVATLVNGRQDAGTYNFNFNASTLASGIYFYRLQASATNGASGSNFVQTKKMMLVK